MSELTKAESADFEALETTIEKGLSTFLEVAKAIKQIKDLKYYEKIGFNNITSYVKSRFGLEKSRAYQLIEVAEIDSKLSTTVEKRPTSERQYRELAKVPEENRAQVLEAANEKAAEQSKPLTASVIKQTAADFFEPKEVEEYEDVDDSELLEPVVESKPKPKPSGGKVKCQVCGGCGEVEAKQTNQSFEHFWTIIKLDAPKGSRLRKNKVKAEKAWPKALAKLAGIESDPAAKIKEALVNYIGSDEGQGKFARNPERLLNEQFWEEEKETWQSSDTEAVARRNQQYDPNVETEESGWV